VGTDVLPQGRPIDHELQGGTVQTPSCTRLGTQALWSAVHEHQNPNAGANPKPLPRTQISVCLWKRRPLLDLLRSKRWDLSHNASEICQ
jgi:hypothetical protein